MSNNWFWNSKVQRSVEIKWDDNGVPFAEYTVDEPRAGSMVRIEAVKNGFILQPLGETYTSAAGAAEVFTSFYDLRERLDAVLMDRSTRTTEVVLEDYAEHDQVRLRELLGLGDPKATKAAEATEEQDLVGVWRTERAELDELTSKA